MSNLAPVIKSIQDIMCRAVVTVSDWMQLTSPSKSVNVLNQEAACLPHFV